jgi:hypothetical protein
MAMIGQPLIKRTLRYQMTPHQTSLKQRTLRINPAQHNPKTIPSTTPSGRSCANRNGFMPAHLEVRDDRLLFRRHRLRGNPTGYGAGMPSSPGNQVTLPPVFLADCGTLGRADFEEPPPLRGKMSSTGSIFAIGCHRKGR